MAPSIFAIALALVGYFAAPVQADDAIDLRGTWLGTYRVVSPTNAFGTGPRFDESEWKLVIETQEDSLFWGESNWRSAGSEDWVVNEATGSVSLDASGDIGVVQTSPNPEIGVNALIDAKLKYGMLFVDFRSITTGAVYSAVLERQSP